MVKRQSLLSSGESAGKSELVEGKENVYCNFNGLFTQFIHQQMHVY